MVYQLRLHHGPGASCIVIGEKVMAIDKKDRPWDGRSRPSDDLYRKEFDRIFKPKTLHEELMEGFKKEQEELEKEEK